MKIDAHQHFWRYSPQDYGWIDHAMNPLKRDFLPEDLFPLMNKIGFDGSISVQARQKLEETQWLLSLSKKYDFIKGVVGWVDLRSKNLPFQLETFKQHSKFKGVRHVIQDEPDDQFILGKAFHEGIRELSHYDLIYEILIFHKHLPSTLKFVEQFPEQPFVLDHIAKPNIKGGIQHPWKENIQRLAEFPNVYCKVSGMVTEADWQNWQQQDFYPFLDTVFECFGTHRLMIGSDWPVCTLGGSYTEILQIVIDYIQDFPQNEQDRILGENAVDIYKISVNKGTAHESSRINRISKI